MTLLSITVAASACSAPIILADFIGAIRFARRHRNPSTFTSLGAGKLREGRRRYGNPPAFPLRKSPDIHARAEPSHQASVIREVAEHKASRIDADVKDRAAREVAEIISEHVPGVLWVALKANLYAAGANNIANALTNITGQSIMDRRYAQ